MSDFKDSNLEDALLTTIVVNADWLDDIVIDTGLTNSVFSCPINRRIFGTIESIISKGMSLDIGLLFHELDVDEDDDSYSFLEVMDPLETIKIAKSYAVKLCELANKRIMLSTLNKARAEIIDNPDMGSSEVNGSIQGVINNGFNSISASENISASAADTLDIVFNMMKENSLKLDGFTGIRTGLPDLDKHTSGFQTATYVIVGGRPAMGKTTAAVQSCLEAARAGSNVRIYSFEMPKEQLVFRLLASISSVDCSKIIKGTLTQSEIARVSAAASEIRGIGDRLQIIDKVLPIHELRADVLKAHRKDPVSMVMIDYFQLIPPRGLDYIQQDTEKLSEMSRILNGLKKEINGVILLLSQLNRGLEARPDKRPVNSDLRATGQLEQDADLIIMCYRDEVYNEDSPLKGVFEYIITKFRAGKIGTVYGHFEGAVYRVGALSSESLSKIKSFLGSTSKAKVTGTKIKKVIKDDEDDVVSRESIAMVKRIEVKDETDEASRDNLDLIGA